jgi:hypothetical protein
MMRPKQKRPSSVARRQSFTDDGEARSAPQRTTDD